MKKFAFILSFFSLLPIILFFFILYSLYVLHTSTVNMRRSIDIFSKGVQYQALPEAHVPISIAVQATDGRAEALRDFFTYYKSPLRDQAEFIVQVADRYSLDYRLIPAIAMQESNLCKKIPYQSYNCWGFGIYGGKVTRFNNYEQAIETVSRTLAKEYIGKGFQEPHEIMTKYTPGSNGSWANSVSHFMQEIHRTL